MIGKQTVISIQRKEKNMKNYRSYIIITVIISFIVFIFLYWINHNSETNRMISRAKGKNVDNTVIKNDIVKINDYGNFHFKKADNEMNAVTENSIKEEMETRHNVYPLYEEVTDAIRNEDLVSFNIIRDDTEYDYSRNGIGYRVSEDPDDYPDYVSDLLRGHKVNDIFKVKVKTDSSGIIFSDGDTECTIKIIKVRRPFKSEISDEWVKTVSRESDTVPEYKEEIKEYLNIKYRQEDPYIMMEEVKDALMENAEWIKEPTDEIKNTTEALIKHRFVGNPGQQEKEKIRYKAEKEVLFYECIKLIAKKENISCTEEDIQKTRRVLNVFNYYSPEQSEEDIIFFNYGNSYSIEDTALIDKIVSHVYKKGL